MSTCASTGQLIPAEPSIISVLLFCCCRLLYCLAPSKSQLALSPTLPKTVINPAGFSGIWMAEEPPLTASPKLTRARGRFSSLLEGREIPPPSWQVAACCRYNQHLPSRGTSLCAKRVKKKNNWGEREGRGCHLALEQGLEEAPLASLAPTHFPCSSH